MGGILGSFLYIPAELAESHLKVFHHRYYILRTLDRKLEFFQWSHPLFGGRGRAAALLVSDS